MNEENLALAGRYCSSDQRFEVVIRPQAATSIISECRKASHIETGGILIGRYSANLRTATVKVATAPPADSKQSRTVFERGIFGVRSLLRASWPAGDYYLGEWHYHPSGAPTPSLQDRTQMQRIGSDPLYRCPEPILVVAAISTLRYLGIGVFVLENREQLIKLSQTSTNP